MLECLKNAKVLHRCVDYLTRQIESRMPLVPTDDPTEMTGEILPRTGKASPRTVWKGGLVDRSAQGSFNIAVCGEEEVPDFHNRGITDLLTCISPERPVLRPTWPTLHTHVIVRCDDVEEPFPDYVCPTEDHVREILRFGQDALHRHRRGATVNVLVHCAAGISRSTAATLLILSMKLGKGAEMAAMRHLTSMRPICRPNAMIIDIGDRLLERNGQIVKQVALWRARHHSAEAIYG